MEKEIKIAELAKIWDISVNATWTRVKKEKLTTIMKVENGREITFVIVSDEILNKYNVNEVHEVVNKADYEVILSDDKHNEQQKIDITNTMIEFTKEINNQIMNINNQHNERIEAINNNYNENLMKYNELHQMELKKLNDELINYKSQIPLLEEKANREGMYVNEINELKKAAEYNNNRVIQLEDKQSQFNEQINKKNEELNAQKKRYLLCIIALSVTFFITVIILVYFLVKAQNKPPKVITTEKVVEKVVNVPVKVKKR